MVEITEEIVKKTKDWLGEDGIKFFKETKEKYGEIAAVYSEGGIPHSVHFNEGMQVRNFLRSTSLCLNWTHHDLDDNWVKIIEIIINK